MRCNNNYDAAIMLCLETEGPGKAKVKPVVFSNSKKEIIQTTYNIRKALQPSFQAIVLKMYSAKQIKLKINISD